MTNLIIMDRQKSNHLKIRKYIKEAGLTFNIIDEITHPDQLERLLSRFKVDLIIGDGNYPGFSAMALLSEYEERQPDLHMILFTEYQQFRPSTHPRIDYLFNPVRKNDVIKSLSHMQHLIDEIAQLKEQKALLHAAYETKQDQFKERFLMNLIYGSLRQNSYILDQLSYYGINADGSFTIAIFKIDHYKAYELAMEEEQRQFFIFQIAHKAQHYMEENGLGISFISRFDEVCLLFTTLSEKMTIMDECEHFHEQVTEDLAIKGTMGIGRTYNDAKLTHLSYDQAVDALLEHHYLGNNTLIHIDYVSHKNDLAYSFLMEQEEMILKYLFSNQLSASQKQLRKVLDTLHQLETLPEEFYPAFCLKLIAHVERDALAMSLPVDNSLNLKGHHTDVYNIHNQEEAFEYLSLWLANMSTFVLKQNQLRDKDLLERAIAYARTFYADRISLGKAALYLGTTPNHLESLIQQAYDQKFYDFCMDNRLEVAKQLLSSTNKTAAEISAEIGFNNTEYFIAIFKQRNRQSPAEYRLSQNPRAYHVPTQRF